MKPTTSSSPWAWPVIAPGPSWNIPRVALPSCLGPLLQYQNEWWYYAGYASDADGNSYSLQFSINRFPLGSADPLLQVIACMTGIGDARSNSYYFTASYSLGISTDPEKPLGLTMPTVTDEQYDLSIMPGAGTTQTRIRLTAGYAGTVKSAYQLHSSAADPDGTYEADLRIMDERGMVLEWQSGFIGPDQSSQFDASSFEFAQPRLRITAGSLVLNGTKRLITSGMLWLDRQVLTYPPGTSTQRDFSDINHLPGPELLAKLSSVSLPVKPLYVGSWMGITLDNGVSMVCTCFWQLPLPGKLQWQTGTLLGLPPKAAYGNLYFKLDADLRNIRNGGSYLRGMELASADKADFDVNILYPDRADDSPHWQSPVGNKATYANGWWVRTDPKWAAQGLPENLYLKALVSGCENVLPAKDIPFSAFWEGAAAVYADKELTELIGHAFVEQMGFN